MTDAPMIYLECAPDMLQGVTPSQASKAVDAQKYSLLNGFPWLAYAAAVLVFIIVIVAAMHFDPIGTLAAYNYEGIN